MKDIKVGNKSIYSVKNALDVRGKLYGWTTEWVVYGSSFIVVRNGEEIARHSI